MAHNSFLRFDDPDASRASHPGHLGFEVRTDVGSGDRRWIVAEEPIDQDDDVRDAAVRHPAGTPVRIQ